jgi:hypothetical protein
MTAGLAAAVVRWVPRDGPADRSRSLNAAGSVAFTAAVMAVIVGTSLVAQPGRRAAGAGTLLAAVALAAGFVRIDRRAVAPLLPAGVRRLTPLRWGAIGASLNTATTSSVMTLATLYLQQARHYRPIAAAGALLPFSLAVVGGAALAAPALRRFSSHRVAAAGLAAIAVADGGLTLVANSDLGLPVCVALAGLGIGLSLVAPDTAPPARSWPGPVPPSPRRRVRSASPELLPLDDHGGRLHDRGREHPGLQPKVVGGLTAHQRDDPVVATRQLHLGHDAIADNRDHDARQPVAGAGLSW